MTYGEFGESVVTTEKTKGLSFRASDRRHWRGNPFPPVLPPSRLRRATSLPEGGLGMRIAALATGAQRLSPFRDDVGHWFAMTMGDIVQSRQLRANHKVCHSEERSDVGIRLPRPLIQIKTQVLFERKKEGSQQNFSSKREREEQDFIKNLFLMKKEERRSPDEETAFSRIGCFRAGRSL